MKFLVTGGAGFIASHIVDRLIEEGHKVAVVDDLSFGLKENLNPRAMFYHMDIRDEGIKDVFKKEKPAIVNHHAAQVNLRKSVENPLFDAEVNILGSINLLECSIKYGVKKFIYSSSGGAVYGEPEALPVKETHEINPLSQYGINKHTVEHYLYVYYVNQQLPYTTLRYPNIYGPRQNPHGEAGVVAIFSEQMLRGEQPTIFGDGSKTRDYLYVSDVVDANMLVIEKGDNETYNLGWGLQVTDYKIFQTVRDAVGCSIEPIYGQKRPGEIDRISLDCSKIRRELSWQPKVPLGEGVAKAVEFYRNNINR
jgi:UDP-glucose 4-epimerase